MFYELKPSKQKSFYGKALVREAVISGVELYELWSYGVHVMNITRITGHDEFNIKDSAYNSQTTRKHKAEFCRQVMDAEYKDLEKHYLKPCKGQWFAEGTYKPE